MEVSQVRIHRPQKQWLFKVLTSDGHSDRSRRARKVGGEVFMSVNPRLHHLVVAEGMEQWTGSK